MSDELQRPTSKDDREGWKAYWEAQGMGWRTEPEIDEERQQYLAERRAVKPDIEGGIYPFQDIELTRADVEWLLATHEDKGVQGPVDLKEEQARWDAVARIRGPAEFKPAYDRAMQQRRKGPDLRGAYLADVDLSGLPLARAGLRHADLSSANLSKAELEEAVLSQTTLRQASLRAALVASAEMKETDLSGADLTAAYLVSADLGSAILCGATLHQTNLEHANLHKADLREANMAGVRLNMACLREADLTGANMRNAHQLREADLTDAKGLTRRSRQA